MGGVADASAVTLKAAGKDIQSTAVYHSCCMKNVLQTSQKLLFSAKHALNGCMSTCSTHFIKCASDVTRLVLGRLGYPTMHFPSAIRSVVVPNVLPF